MSVIQIRKAKRDNARLVIGLAGVSGSGKTYSALLLALGLAGGDASKVGMLDTENRRGSLYADALKGAAAPTDEPFLIGDLFAPFSPQRYIDAIEEFQRAGVEVLVIDSVTHEWEGTGGCEEIATAGSPKVPRWNLAKAEHKRFMNKLLQSDMHIIVCIRAREKVEVLREKNPETGRTETVFKPLGVQPIQEKNFMFEVTCSLMMWNSGKSHEVMKAPEELMPLLSQEGYINDTHGRALREWVAGGNNADQKIEKWRNSLQSNAEKGVTHIEDCWTQVPAGVKKKLGEVFYKSLIESAKSHDELRALGAGNQAANTSLDSLNAGIADAS
jgi:hypothetical protein